MAKLNDTARLCFSVAVMCLAMGAVGATANLIVPDATTLDALLIVAVFYAGLGFLSLPRSSCTTRCDQTDGNRDGTGVEKATCRHEFQSESMKRAA